jgi:hypothetical protein
MIDPPEAAFEFQRGLPSRALSLDLSLVDPNRRRPSATRKALAFGDVPTNLIRDLRSGGMDVVRAQTVRAAVERLAAETYSAVVVEAQVPRVAFSFVRAIKSHGEISLAEFVLDHWTFDAAEGSLTDVRAPSELLRQASSRNTLTPVFVLPIAGDNEYAVIVSPPRVAYLEDMNRIPVARAILKLDVTALPSAWWQTAQT